MNVATITIYHAGEAILPPSAERWRESIAEIRRATEFGSTSVRQLLAFSCRQILEPKVLDLNAGGRPSGENVAAAHAPS